MHPFMGATNPYSSPGVPIPYEYFMSRGNNPNTYNQLVKPPPYRLGQETPDCGKVIFNADRATPFGRIIPKAKKKRRNSRLLKRPPFSGKKSISPISCESNCCKANPPYDVQIEGGENIRNWLINQESDDEIMSICSQQKIIEVELDEDEVHSFMEGVRKYESDLIMEKGSKPSLQDRNLFTEISKDVCNSCESNQTACQLSEKIDNFIEYYKLICGKNKKLPTSLIKELIIKLMYNKLFLLTHLGIGSEKFMFGNQVDRLSALWSNERNESKIEKLFPSSDNSSDDENPTKFSRLEKLHQRANARSDSEGCFDNESESDDEDYNGRGHRLSSPPSAPREGGFSAAAETSDGWLADSLVSRRPFSCVDRTYRRGSGSVNSDTELDHAHDCDENCDMPCKASGIPVYQCRSGQVKGAGQRITAPTSSLVKNKTITRTNYSKYLSDNDKDSLSERTSRPVNETYFQNSSNTVAKNSPKFNSKPPASPAFKKLSRIPNRSRRKENGHGKSSPFLSERVENCVDKNSPLNRENMEENCSDEPGKNIRRRKTDTSSLSVNQPRHNSSTETLLAKPSEEPLEHRKKGIASKNKRCNSNSSLCTSASEEFSSCKELCTALSLSETKIYASRTRLTPSPVGNFRVSSLERNRDSIVSRIMNGDSVEMSGKRNYVNKTSFGGSHSPIYKERLIRGHHVNSTHSDGDKDSSTRNSTPTSSSDGQSSDGLKKMKNPRSNEKEIVQKSTSTRLLASEKRALTSDRRVLTSEKRVLTSEKRGELNNNRIRKENSLNTKSNVLAARTAAVDSSASGGNMGVKRYRQKSQALKRIPGPLENSNKGRNQKCFSPANLINENEKTVSNADQLNPVVAINLEGANGYQTDVEKNCNDPFIAKIKVSDEKQCNESEKESNLHIYNPEPVSECNNIGVARYQQREARSAKFENNNNNPHELAGSPESNERHENEGGGEGKMEEHKNMINVQKDPGRGNNCERPLISDFDKARLSKIIDISLLENLKLDGELLEGQFDAIITTLKKVAESMDCITEGQQGLQTFPRGFFEKPTSNRSATLIKNANNRTSKMNRSFSAPNYAASDDVSRKNRRPFSIYDFVHLKQENCYLESNGKFTKTMNNERIDSGNRCSFDKQSNEKVDYMKSLTKSRELLHLLENEYKLLKGEETSMEANNKASILQGEAKCLAKKFKNILEPNNLSLNEKSFQNENPIDSQNFFPFIKNRCHSLSLPRGDKVSSVNNTYTPQRSTYKDLTLSHMGIPQPNYNSSKSNGSFARDSLQEEPPEENIVLINGKSHYILKDLNDSEDDEKNHQRSLSLPKSFLSDKYGLNGLRTAITSVTFPWRREQLGYNDANLHQHYEDSLKEEGMGLEEDHPIAKECFSEDIFCQFSSAKSQAPSVENVQESKQRRNSSFSRSSISHSEWDIRRPWSTADADSSILSQSTCRLEASNHVNEELQARHAEALSIPYQNNSSVGYQNSHEGMFQKFKKSLSLRLNKKSSRSESPAGDKSLSSLPLEVPFTSDDLQTSMMTSPRCSGKEDDSKSNYFKFGHPIFRSSKERRKAKLKDIRSSKCNSGDSGDSGIEVISGTSTLVGGELTPSLTCREDSTPTIINYLGHNNGTCEEAHENDNNMGVRRTQSDMSGKHPTTKHLSCSDFVHRQSLGRQYSSPQPIKLRPHHRLPNYNSVSTVQVQRNHRLRRSRASTHLRRSVSQPLDLDKSFQAQVSLHKMRTTDDDPSAERLRRPSVDNLLSEENTSEEEGGMSDGEEFKPDFKLYMEEEEEMIVYAEALWDHISLDCDELVFKAGDLITVVDSSDRDWWWGRIPPRSGWFPASFVRLLVNQEDHLTKSDDADDPGIWNDRQLSISSLSQDEIRSNVINEILSTERDYVKHLKDVVEGYLKQVRKRPDMFNEESISTIFGNMEALFSFHTEFLKQLEACMDFKEPHLSCIGDCFTTNKTRFEIYSEYCNNHPLAVSELQQLYQYQKYVHFFEACRLLQEMIDISLDGFLLTPVQKICKYPLQLQELLKYTQPYHKDYSSVHGAMQAMKEVALLVNERRRRMECLEKIATWQKSVEGWEGPDLLEDSSQLIHQGEVTKGVNTSWPKEVCLFLFDHQLIYCKKDLLKRNTFVYRGRINTDLCEVFAIPFDPTRSAALQNAWKIHCLHKNKTYLFSCKTPAEKIKWLNAFKKERELVAIDEESGFVASERQKQVARLAARNQKSKPKKPKTVKSHKRTQVMTYAQAHLLVNDGEIRSNSLPLRGSQESKKKGLWFSFGGHKKSRGSKQNSILND